jgi:hypothetical protein
MSRYGDPAPSIPPESPPAAPDSPHDEELQFGFFLKRRRLGGRRKQEPRESHGSYWLLWLGLLLAVLGIVTTIWLS